MRLFRAGVAAAVMTLASPALAHTHVRATSIAENAVLDQSPTTFAVTFSEPAAIANVTLATAQGAPVALNYTPPGTMQSAYDIPLPALSPGAYALSWRMIARDGHAMSGAVHFTVRPAS